MNETISIIHDKSHCFAKKLEYNQTNLYQRNYERVKSLNGSLLALSPLNVLERGYAFITNSQNQVIKDSSLIDVGDDIIAHTSKHQIRATVKEKKQT